MITFIRLYTLTMILDKEMADPPRGCETGVRTFFGPEYVFISTTSEVFLPGANSVWESTIQT